MWRSMRGMTTTPTPRQAPEVDHLGLSLEQLEAATTARELLSDEYAKPRPDWNLIGAYKAAIRACHEAANVHALLAVATRPLTVMALQVGDAGDLSVDAALAAQASAEVLQGMDERFSALDLTRERFRTPSRLA